MISKDRVTHWNDKKILRVRAHQQSAHYINTLQWWEAWKWIWRWAHPSWEWDWQKNLLSIFKVLKQKTWRPCFGLYCLLHISLGNDQFRTFSRYWSLCCGEGKNISLVLGVELDIRSWKVSMLYNLLLGRCWWNNELIRQRLNIQ